MTTEGQIAIKDLIFLGIWLYTLHADWFYYNGCFAVFFVRKNRSDTQFPNLSLSS